MFKGVFHQISVNLPSDQLNQLDKLVEKNKKFASRSEALRVAVEQFLMRVDCEL